MNHTGTNGNFSLHRSVISATLQKLMLSNLKHSRKLWKALRRGTIRLGLGVTSIGAVCLTISYLSSSVILTFIGLGLTLWGLLLLYISQPSSIPRKVFDALSFSMLKSINAIVDELYHGDTVVHFYRANRNGLAQGYIYFTNRPNGAVRNYEQLNSQEISQNDLNGTFILSPSQGLLDLFEKELNVNFAKIDFPFLERTLPDMLVEELKIVDYFLIESNDDTFAIRFSGEPSVHLCKLINEKSKVGYRIGCPVCGMLALALSKSTGRPIRIKQTITEGDGSNIKTVYEKIRS
ncbi:MAG: hypothetical protein M3298_09390 [Thermoproteota archaeon]|nr:hypothetical protein [Thermoproteota archaeon]